MLSKKYWNKKTIILNNISIIYKKNLCIAFSLSLFLPKYLQNTFFLYISSFFIFFLKRIKYCKIYFFCLTLGILSNNINRFFNNYVIDFIDIKLIFLNTQYATFNLSDLLILISTLFLLFLLIKLINY